MNFSFKQAFLVSIIIISLSLGSFMLGGLFVYSLYIADNGTQNNTPSLRFDPLKSNISIELGESRVYASKNGTRYYPWWCNSGSRILEENIVWFTSAEEAKVEGYTIAKNCDK